MSKRPGSEHYVDERPTGPDRGTFLLLHGEPTWAYLYRDWIEPLVADGFRVVVPGHLGFGRSDKPADDDWYSIARHRRALEVLIAELDLRDIELVVQDWGGPIGLCTTVADPDRSPVHGAGHFVQIDAPDDCLAIVRRYANAAS